MLSVYLVTGTFHAGCKGEQRPTSPPGARPRYPMHMCVRKRAQTLHHHTEHQSPHTVEQTMHLLRSDSGKRNTSWQPPSTNAWQLLESSPRAQNGPRPPHGPPTTPSRRPRSGKPLPCGPVHIASAIDALPRPQNPATVAGSHAHLGSTAPVGPRTSGPSWGTRVRLPARRQSDTSSATARRTQRQASLPLGLAALRAHLRQPGAHEMHAALEEPRVFVLAAQHPHAQALPCSAQTTLMQQRGVTSVRRAVVSGACRPDRCGCLLCTHSDSTSGVGPSRAGPPLRPHRPCMRLMP